MYFCKEGFGELRLNDAEREFSEGDNVEVDGEGIERPAVFGTWKVKEPCLSAIFSDCSLASRSRRFSFSEFVCSLRASRAATLSSSWGKLSQDGSAPI